MVVLSDITAQVTNRKRRSNASSLGYHPISSPAEKENHGKSTSPHFMTPTFASKQFVTPTVNSRPRSTTPVPTTSTKQGHGSTFLNRVGLRRVTDTSSSRKDNVLNYNKGISFPDGVSVLLLLQDMTES